MPTFGVNSACEIYQHEIATALAGTEGINNISNDIIDHAPDQLTHDKRLRELSRRLCDSGLTLNADKCTFNMDNLVFTVQSREKPFTHLNREWQRQARWLTLIKWHQPRLWRKSRWF